MRVRAQTKNFRCYSVLMQHVIWPNTILEELSPNIIISVPHIKYRLLGVSEAVTNTETKNSATLAFSLFIQICLHSGRDLLVAHSGKEGRAFVTWWQLTKGRWEQPFMITLAGFLHADQRVLLLLGNLWLAWGLGQALQKIRSLADEGLEAKLLAQIMPSPWRNLALTQKPKSTAALKRYALYKDTNNIGMSFCCWMQDALQYRLCSKNSC